MQPDSVIELEQTLIHARSTNSQDDWLSVLQMSPSSVEAWSSLGLSAHAAGQHKQARQHFEEAIAYDVAEDMTVSAQLACNLGLALHSEGSLAKAVVQYQAAVKMDSTLDGCWKLLADALESAGDSSRADDARKNAIKAASDRSEL